MKKRLLALILSLFSLGALADSSFKITEEDDIFGPANYDHYYTQGLDLSWSDGRNFAGIGQLMYTPDNIRIPTPQTNDHPWCGLLYADYGRIINYSNSVLTLKGEIGVTGKPSLAKEAQTEVHQLIKNALPQGWGNQLGGNGDFIINADALYSYRFTPAAGQGMGAEFWGNVRGSMGLLYDAISAGPEVRFGWNLPEIESPQIYPTLNANSKLPFRLYATVGADVDYVPYNYFIEGSMLYSDPNATVTEKPLLYQVNGSINLSIPVGNAEIFTTYRCFYRSKEFEQEAYNGETSGSITIGYGRRF